jgi:hypothetical protein
MVIPNYNGVGWLPDCVNALAAQTFRDDQVLAVKRLQRLLYGQLYFLIAYRRPGASLAGYAAFVPCLPHVRRERRRMRASRRIDVVAIDRLLTTRMREPPLRVLLRHRLGRLWS